MPMPALWFILLVIFGIIEAATVGLTSIWFAAGALVAMISAFFQAPIWLQIALFLGVSLIALGLVRPIVRKFILPGYTPTNADRILGKDAVVTEAIDNLSGKGLVSVAGSVWTARSEDSRVIPAGTVVRILRIEGVKVFVAPAEVGAAAPQE